MESASVWEDMDRYDFGTAATCEPEELINTRAMGQMFVMGFDGTEVTPQIQSLIEKHHLGTILLTAKNLICIISLSTPVVILLSSHP